MQIKVQEVNIVVLHFEIEKQADYNLVLELVFFFFFKEKRTYLRT